MGAKTKKIKAAGRFGAGYGTLVRKEFNSIEARQRKKQQSPFHPRGRVKRIAAGIWQCLKTGKVFAGPAYSLNVKK
jgi:large subunit ribosomal protein L37Ae